MSTSKPQLAEAESTSSPGAFRVYTRVVEWVTKERFELVNINERINDIVRKSGVREGLVHIQSLHTTTAVFLNEWQEALLGDVRTFFEQIVETGGYWRHNDPQYSDCERANADAHLRGMIMGQTLCLQVRNGVVLLGTWQNIIFGEFDGPRSRSVAVQVTGV